MGIESLGYVGFKVARLDAWAAFATNVLGLMKVASPGGVTRFRVDTRAWRIAIEEGGDDDISYVGLEVAGPSEFNSVVDRLSAAGVNFEEGAPDLLKERGVTRLVCCKDPDGLEVEIYFGSTERREIPFVSPIGVSNFVTGEQGLGHVALGTENIVACRQFYQDVLGFRLSDVISVKRPDMAADIEFYHCNPRHHTLAFVPVKGKKRLHHFMLQAETLDDVGFAIDRAQESKAPIALSLGKHTNDSMVSSYIETPAGFLVEYGWGALKVEDSTWRVVRHEKTSIWGHKRLQAH